MHFRTITGLLLAAAFCRGEAARAQQFGLNEGCGQAKEMVIDATGIHAVSKNRKDTLVASAQNNTVYFTPEGAGISTWYKLFVNADCRISFEIFPMQKENRYNFFFYRQNENISLCDIKGKQIEPLRANLFEDEMFYCGTGLSPSSSVTHYDTASADARKDFYHTAYHASVQAKTGEVYYLNIYHVSGYDCGYRFALRADSYSQAVESLLPPCYTDKVQPEKVKRYVNPYPLRYISDVSKPAVNAVPVPLPPVKKEEEVPKATFLVRDSLKHAFISAEVSRIQKGNVSKAKVTVVSAGKYEMLLENNSKYHLVFSCMGYKSSDVLFITGPVAKSFTNDIYLVPCKAGDNFTMDELYFYPNTYTMRPDGKAELNRLLSYLKNNPSVSIEIQGHTNGNNRIRSSYGSGFKGSSKKLSQYRSDVIKKYLVDNGISAERLSAVGYGGSKMIYPDPRTQSQANKNIRVEVLILSEKEAALSSKSR